MIQYKIYKILHFIGNVIYNIFYFAVVDINQEYNLVNLSKQSIYLKTPDLQ